PPKNETPEEKAIRLQAEAEATRISQLIDAQIKTERAQLKKESENTHKILLLVPSLRNAFPNPTVTQNLAYVPSVTNQVDGETPSKADSTPGPELSEEAAYVLRAAAIDACEMIVRRARGLNVDNSGGEEWIRELNLPELDG
ncbi:16619_t:CDS:2, partial [Acaulospora colombiana]